MADNNLLDEGSKKAQHIWERYRRNRDARVASGFDQSARDAVDFRFGNQLTSTEHDEMQSINQPDVVFNRVHSAIERSKATLTARTPSFTALPREDSDQKLASTWRIILEYIWDVSEGNVQYKQVVDDFLTAGVGYMLVYVDREADAGRGEVKVEAVPWEKVYWDASCRKRFNQDANEAQISNIVSRRTILRQYPELEEIDPESDRPLIDILDKNEWEEDYPSSGQRNTNSIQTPDQVKDIDFSQDRYKIITHFEPIKVPFYWVIDNESERLVSAEQFKQLIENQEFLLAYQAKKVQIKEIMQTRWQETGVLGKHILYETILNTDICPIVPFPNIWTETPYPKSSINIVKDANRLLNKVYSTLVTHLQTSAGSKVLVPEGSVDDIKVLEQQWANPLAVIEFNADYGQPIVAGTSPASGDAYGLIPKIEEYIDRQMEVGDLQLGLKSGATGAVRTDMMLQEQGETRGRAKLQDIEFALSRVGQIAHNVAKGHYTVKKTFRIVQPNNSVSKATANVYTQRQNEAATIANDITIGFFDIKVVAGSSMPSNREKELAQSIEAYKMGLLNKIQVWKKMDVDNLEEMIQQDSEIAQARSMIESLQEQVKKLSGDMQTADRELRSSDRKVEREKVKADLTKITANAKSGTDTEKVKLAERSASMLDRLNFQINQATASLQQGKDVNPTKK